MPRVGGVTATSDATVPGVVRGGSSSVHAAVVTISARMTMVRFMAGLYTDAGFAAPPDPTGGSIPTRRTLDGSHPIADLDASDWIWPHATAALVGAFPADFHSPPGDDDALERLILDASAAPIALAPRPAPEPTRPSAERTRKRDRMKRALRSWFSR